MGVIWLELNNGEVIHMPIVGVDYNTVDTPFPSSDTTCWMKDGKRVLTILHPELGPTDYVVEAIGRSGSCISCGQCCTHSIDDCPNKKGECGWQEDIELGVHACEYLEVTDLGKEGGAKCSIWKDILDRFKGCLLTPERQGDILPHMTSCGFSFNKKAGEEQGS